jgi:hypothetical protein
MFLSFCIFFFFSKRERYPLAQLELFLFLRVMATFWEGVNPSPQLAITHQTSWLLGLLTIDIYHSLEAVRTSPLGLLFLQALAEQIPAISLTGVIMPPEGSVGLWYKRTCTAHPPTHIATRQIATNQPQHRSISARLLL